MLTMIALSVRLTVAVASKIVSHGRLAEGRAHLSEAAMTQGPALVGRERSAAPDAVEPDE